MEFGSCFLSGGSIYELVPRYAENLLAPAKLRHFETVFCYEPNAVCVLSVQSSYIF